MQIPVNSNVFTALYLVISDIVLPIIITWVIRVILSNWNARRVYQEQRTLALTTTRLSLFTHQGLTEKPAGRLTALSSTFIIALALIGSFSIRGLTEEYKPWTNAPVLVDAAEAGEEIDFTQHVSENGTLVSGTFLAVYNSLRCFVNKEGDFFLFSSVNDLEDLTTVKWSVNEVVSNSTCRMEENDFADEIAVHFKGRRVHENSRCLTSVQVLDETARISKAKVEVGDSCFFRVLDSWCAFNMVGICVAGVQFPEGFGYLTFRLQNTTDNRLSAVQSFLSLEVMERSYSTASLRSLAYLLSTGIGASALNRVVLLKVRRDVNIQKRLTRDVTEVDVAFFICTFGVAVAVTLTGVFAAAALIFWPCGFPNGRLAGNCFHSSKDMLQSVVYEAFGDAGVRPEQQVAVRIGVSRTQPHVGPLDELDEAGTTFFLEEELES